MAVYAIMCASWSGQLRFREFTDCKGELRAKQIVCFVEEFVADGRAAE